jgi:hypothetical protein
VFVVGVTIVKGFEVRAANVEMEPGETTVSFAELHVQVSAGFKRQSPVRTIRAAQRRSTSAAMAVRSARCEPEKRVYFASIGECR